MTAICKDCGMDTTPCSGKRGCRHKGRWEYYMVTDHVWHAARAGDGFLCIGCLETRLGRLLTPGDFKRTPTMILNNPEDPWHTLRLRSRLLGVSETAATAWEPQQRPPEPLCHLDIVFDSLAEKPNATMEQLRAEFVRRIMLPGQDAARYAALWDLAETIICKEFVHETLNDWDKLAEFDEMASPPADHLH